MLRIEETDSLDWRSWSSTINLFVDAGGSSDGEARQVLKGVVVSVIITLYDLTKFLQIHAEVKAIEEVEFIFLGESKVPGYVGGLQTEHVNFFGIIS